MTIRPVLALSCIFTAAAFAAEAPKAPAIPSHPIAKKKELLFSDDFKGSTPDKRWHRVVDTFKVEDGMLKCTQTRDKDVPAADGKPEVKAHAAVFGLEVPTKDSVVEAKIKFEGATMIDIEFDDRKFTGSHYGHIARAQIRLDKVVMLDEREGSQNEAIKALQKDPSTKAEAAKMLVGKSAAFPAKFEPGKWYTFTVEVAGDEMRASIDGKAVGYLKSAGIGHATKSKIELGVAGKDGYFGEIKVWNAEAAK